MARKMPRNGRVAAWVQLVAMLTVIALSAAWSIGEERRPFDAETLSILTGQLRSTTREARELVRLDAMHASSTMFTRQHARQLGEHAAEIGKALHDKPAVTALEAVRRDAEDVTTELERALSAIAQDKTAANAQDANLDRLDQRSGSVHRRVKSGG